MGTITSRKRQDGAIRYRAQVRIKRNGKVVYSESQTFGKKGIARDWIRTREEELQKPGALERVMHKGVTVGELIGRYIKEVDSINPFGRSKDAALNALKGMGIADRDALTLKASEIIDHVRSRRSDGTGPATVGQDIAWLRVVLKYARRAWNVPVDVQQVEDAAETARDARLIARPRRRQRRPSVQELEALDAYFASRQRSSVPMRLIMWLAIYSTRRQDELCRIRRGDLDSAHGTGVLRDVKHPDGSSGNNREFVLPAPGWRVVERILAEVPSDNGLLLPFESKTISAYFTRACQTLGIEDLRFHDLRHEGASRLAEDGYTIPELQQVTLHESWSSLSVYVQMTNGRRRQRVDLVAGEDGSLRLERSTS